MVKAEVLLGAGSGGWFKVIAETEFSSRSGVAMGGMAVGIIA
jgi:hypothetical protein